MTIIKNEIPILEFDSDEEAVLMPDHEKLGYNFPEKAVYAFLEDFIDKFALSNNAKILGYFISATKKFPIYEIDFKGEKVCLVQAPVGASPSVQLLDWLISYGVRKVISTGSCGVLVDIEENIFLVPKKALRDEGTSYHYLKPSRYIDMNKEVLKAIEEAILENNLEYKEVVTWSTDGFYRETKAKIEYRKQEGCEVVEMECSALAACAKMRKIIWGTILFTADSLCDFENYNERNWGYNSWNLAFKLCLDSVSKL